MSRFYRIAIWLPILVPLLTWGGVQWVGMPSGDVLSTTITILMLSLVYGGPPYGVLALWATWRVGVLGESGIQKLALLAPLMMVLAFLAYAAVLGAMSGNRQQGMSFFALGAAIILPLGYAYVAFTLALRRIFARLGWLDIVSPPTTPQELD